MFKINPVSSALEVICRPSSIAEICKKHVGTILTMNTYSYLQGEIQTFLQDYQRRLGYRCHLDGSILDHVRVVVCPQPFDYQTKIRVYLDYDSPEGKTFLDEHKEVLMHGEKQT